jgi:hypothetical protein
MKRLHEFTPLIPLLVTAALGFSVLHELSYFFVVGSKFFSILSSADFIKSALFWLPLAVLMAVLSTLDRPPARTFKLENHHIPPQLRAFIRTTVGLFTILLIVAIFASVFWWTNSVVLTYIAFLIVILIPIFFLVVFFVATLNNSGTLYIGFPLAGVALMGAMLGFERGRADMTQVRYPSYGTVLQKVLGRCTC